MIAKIMKNCRDCKKDIERSLFYKNRRATDGLQTRCIPCDKKRRKLWDCNNPRRSLLRARSYYKKNREKLLAYNSEWAKKNKIRKLDKQMQYTHGITLAEYNAMVIYQNGLCLICKRAETAVTANGTIQRLSIDHCHKTGKIRGLLCMACNHGLGNFRDDTQRMLAAIQYLIEHQTS